MSGRHSSFDWRQPAGVDSAVVAVLVIIQVVVLIVIVVPVIVIIIVEVVVFVVIVFVLVVAIGPAFGLADALEVHFPPGLEVDLLDFAVEIFDLDQFRILVDGQDAESLVFLDVLVPLAGGRFEVSAHAASMRCARGRGNAALSYTRPVYHYRFPAATMQNRRPAAPASPLARARRIVVKVGSALLVDSATGRVNRAWLETLVLDLVRLRRRGQEVILVSSGAIALGRRHLGLSPGVLRLEESQAAAAVGQIRLAHAYKELFEAHEVTVAQVLLTPDDSERRRRYLNARATLNALLALGALPVINENDTVATTEIRYGDNDRLAARVAQMASADCVLLLSDVDGLYTADPNRSAGAQFVDRVLRVTPEIEAMAGAAVSGVGTGGMATKIAAARIALSAGASLCIAAGAHKHPVRRLEQGARCTWFVPQGNPASSRKQWIAGTLRPNGAISVDEGALRALHAGKSLLPAGITEARGRFDRGDTISVLAPDGREIARGIAAYGDADVARIRGMRTREAAAILGYRGRDEMIHRDDLVMMDDAGHD